MLGGARRFYFCTVVSIYDWVSCMSKQFLRVLCIHTRSMKLVFDVLGGTRRFYFCTVVSVYDWVSCMSKQFLRVLCINTTRARLMGKGLLFLICV